MKSKNQSLNNIVLDSLIDAETGAVLNKNVVLSLDDQFSPYNKIHISGQPGTGKSTVLGQIVNLLESMPDFIFFDHVQAYVEEIVRSKTNKKNSQFWSKKEWRFFEKLLNSSIKSSPVPSIIETPFILIWEKETHGQRMFKKITSSSPKTYFLYIVADPNTIDRSKELRELKKFASVGLVSLINNRFNTFFAGFDDTEISGGKIKEIVGRMAPPKSIEKIQKKARKIFRYWSKNPKSKKLYEKYLNQVKLPKSYRNLTKEQEQDIKNEAAFMLFFFKEELNLKKNSYKVVFNPFLKDIKIYFQIKLLE